MMIRQQKWNKGKLAEEVFFSEKRDFVMKFWKYRLLILVFIAASDDSFVIESHHEGYLEARDSVVPSEMPFVATFQGCLPLLHKRGSLHCGIFGGFFNEKIHCFYKVIILCKLL